MAEALRELDAPRALRHLAAFAPAGVAALLFERAIEERLGGPRGIAAAQIGAGIALAAADGMPAKRDANDARVADALAIGLGQAVALVPGVSRNGATLSAARLLRFRRRAASRMSRHAALPIILAATGLKGARLAARGLPADLRAPFAAGAAAAFASTLAASRLVPAIDAIRSHLPFAAYRVALGSIALVRLNGRDG